MLADRVLYRGFWDIQGVQRISRGFQGYPGGARDIQGVPGRCRGLQGYPGGAGIFRGF